MALADTEITSKKKFNDTSSSPQEEHYQIEKDENLNLNSNSNNDDLPFPDYAPIVFRCFNQKSCFRYLLLKLISWSWFDNIMLFVIIVNCITMGMYEPCETECDTLKCRFLNIIDDFIFFFSLVKCS